MSIISPRHTEQLLEKLQPHFDEMSTVHQDRFYKLVELITSSQDGTFSRKTFNQKVYSDGNPDSIRSDLPSFKSAIKTVGNKAGVCNLTLHTPPGQGSPKQTLWLETETVLSASVPDSTKSATGFIAQQPSVSASAKDLSLKVAVSFAGLDQKSAEELIQALKTALRARRDKAASNIRFWMFRLRVGDDGILCGENDHETIQAEFRESIVGLLLVSPAACSREYIQAEEWPLFRNKEGEVLKPFCAVQLSPVDARKHNLGVLDSTEKGRTQLFNLVGDSWNKCKDNDAQRDAFVEKLVDQLLAKIEKASSEQPPTPPDSKPPSRKTERESRLHAIWANSAETIPAKGKDCGNMQVGRDLASSTEGVLIVPALLDWAGDSDDSPFAVLLGEYGMGKTWNSQLFALELENRLATHPATPVPYYFDLRKTIQDKDALLSGDLPTLELLLDKLSGRSTPAGKKSLSGRDILYAVQKEGALIIFDGLDEVLAHKRDDAWGQQFIDLLFSALPFSCWPKRLNPATESPKPGKILLTCRTHYFKSVQTQNSQILGVGREQQAATNPHAWQMLPFSKEQILEYLKLHLPGHDPQDVFDLLASVHNLTEVSERPQGLKMVCAQIDRIETAKREGKTVNGATIYDFMVEEWLARDTGKHILLEEDKRDLMQDLALYMWQNSLREIRWNRLQKWFRQWLHLDPVRQNIYSKISVESLLTDLRNATFLVRPGEDAFAFAHTSILEYFLARRLHRSLEEGEVSVWNKLKPSHETLVFLLQHQQTCEPDLQELARQTLAKHLAHAGDDETARASWVELFLLAPEEWHIHDTLDISGLDFEQRIFENLHLENLCADNAKLAETLWMRCHFTSSRWKKADCSKMFFIDVQCANADFNAAILHGARFHRAVLDGGCFQDARLVKTDFSDCRAERTMWRQAYCSDAIWHGVALAESDWTDAHGQSPQFLFCTDAPAATGSVLWQKVQILPAETTRKWGLEKIDNNFAYGVVYSCAWSPDGTRLLSGNWGGDLIVWDAQTGQRLVGMKAGGTVESCAWSPDGTRLLSGDDNNNLIVWDARTGQRLVGMKAGGTVESCAWSPDGTRLLSGNLGDDLIVWDAQTGQRLKKFLLPKNHPLVGEFGGGHLFKMEALVVSPCAWSPDGTRLLSGGGGGILIVWDARTGTMLVEMKMKLDSVVHSCAWSPDGTRLLSGDNNDSLIVWDAQTGRRLVEMKAGSNVYSCAWSPDGTRLLSGDDNGSLIVWDVQTGTMLVEMKMKLDSIVHSCAWSPDGTRLLSGSNRGNLIVWDAQTGQRLKEFLLSKDSQLAWEPATGKITHAAGFYWRDFYWEATLPNGCKEQLPIEIFGKLE